MKKMSVIFVILANILIVVGIIFIYSNNNDEETFEILGGKLPICSKEFLTQEDYEDENTNIVFTNQNYEMNEYGNRVNISEKLKEKHVKDGLEITNFTIRSRRCNEKNAEFSFNIKNTSNANIDNITVYINFKNNDDMTTNIIGIPISIKKGEQTTITNNSSFRIIDSKDFDIYIENNNSIDNTTN